MVDIANLQIKVDSKQVKQADKALDKLDKTVVKLEKDTGKLEKQEKKLDRETVKLEKDTGKLEKQEKKLDRETVKLEKDTRRLEKSLRKTSKQFKDLKGGAFSLKRAFATLGLGLFVQQSIKASIQLDTLINRMEAATKNTDVAAQSFKFIRDLSDDLGLVFQDTADVFAGFAASALRSGLTFGETKNIFEDVATATRSLKLPVARVNLVFRALEQISSKGVVSMEEIKRQLGDSLPGAVNIAAKSMGLLPGAFIKLVEAGEVVSKDFLPNFAKTIRDELGGSAAKAATQLQSETNRLKTAFF